MGDGLQEALGLHRLVWRKRFELVIQQNRHDAAVRRRQQRGAGKKPNPELCTGWAGPVRQVGNYARRREKIKAANSVFEVLIFIYFY